MGQFLLEKIKDIDFVCFGDGEKLYVILFNILNVRIIIFMIYTILC